MKKKVWGGEVGQGWVVWEGGGRGLVGSRVGIGGGVG